MRMVVMVPAMLAQKAHLLRSYRQNGSLSTRERRIGGKQN
jgi:hypothetical protein